MQDTLSYQINAYYSLFKQAKQNSKNTRDKRHKMVCEIYTAWPVIFEAIHTWIKKTRLNAPAPDTIIPDNAESKTLIIDFRNFTDSLKVFLLFNDSYTQVGVPEVDALARSRAALDRLEKNLAGIEAA